MSLIVDKEAVMNDVMRAINKHYAGYEQNLSEMETIIKQLPMVKKIIRENEGNRDHAIIIAFGPMPNPKYAVSVVIENGESGGSVAGPVAIAVLNSLVGK